MPILNLQKRARELGRIRIGQVVPTTKRDGTQGLRPEKLDRFRFTSDSKPLLEKVASLYGGSVVEWLPQGGGAKAWEVISTSNRIPILVPPQPVGQWMELWAKSGCVRRCDTVTEMISDSPCICRENELEECKPHTRLNVVLRDVEGIGVWRLETKGWNAAMELPDSAEFLAQAGGYVEGWLGLKAVQRPVDGSMKHWMVPIIEIDVTPAALMRGEGRIQAPELEGPVQQKALPSGVTDNPMVSVLAPYYELLAEASTSGDCMDVFQRAKDAGIFHGDRKDLHPLVNALYDAIGERGRALAALDDGEPVEGEVVPDSDGDADLVWQQVLAEAGNQGMTLAMVEADFVDRYAISTSMASASELGVYLQALKDGEAA